MKKILLGIMALMLSVMTVWAERVSESDAALVADHFMNVTSTASANRAPGKRMKMQKAATAPEAQYYIYENTDGEGWVIIAANDVVRPILAYSETGHFRTDDMPSNVKGWLQSYDKQIKYVAQHTTEAPTDVKRQWAKLRKGTHQAKATVVVSPLIQSGWSQSAPYYNQCPMDGSKRSVTGCVATAMAQVMNYHKWPKQGTGSHTITVNSTDYTVNFGNTTYDWNNMLDHYTALNAQGYEYVISGLTNAQKNAVATLMYHCGVAVDMQYSANVSGAYTIDYNGYFSGQGTMCAETALKQFFGYNSETVKGYPRDGYTYRGLKKWTKSEWIAMLKEELDAARPIMYAGVGCDDPNNDETCYGHSFICDGYNSDNYFHFNFGWTNWCDGYYEVDALNTNDPGTGGGNGEYNLEQDVIIGIQPPIQGHDVVKNATGCTITCASSVENNTAFTANITPTDDTYDFTSLTVKLGNTTLQETTHYTLSDDKKTLTILASAITGDVSNNLTITAVWTKNRYTYEMLGDNCTPDEAGGMLDKNAALNLTITPASGYTLAFAECWDVEMGGNALTYGTDFTYNAANGAFQIASVTGDVAIYVYGKKAVTWMSRGEVFATTLTSSDKYVLPTSNPTACSDGRAFVGWCATADYQSETTAPTFIKGGDDATQYTLYAVFAQEGQGGPVSTQKATSIAIGDKMVLVCEDASNEMTSIASYGVSTPYSETPAGTYPFDVVAGSASGKFAFKNGDNYIAWSSGNSLSLSETLNSNSSWTVSFNNNGRAIITNVNTSGRVILWNVSSPRFAAYEGKTIGSQYYAVQLYKVTAGSYSNYSTSCTAPEPCALTSITLNTENVKKEYYTNELFTSEGLAVTANYSNCVSKTVTTASVSTPDMTVAGQKTVTVSYTENEVTKEATYNITVSELPRYSIRFFNNGEQIGETQSVTQGQQAEVPANPTTSCEGFTFVGWWTATLAADNTEAKTWVSDFTATKDQDYYAIYSRTTEGGLSNDYQKITSLSDLTTGNYVVAGNGTKALKNTVYNNYYLSTTSVSPSNNIISNPAANIIWNITRTNNTVSLYNEDVTKYAYLYQAGSYYDLGLRDEAYNFNISVSNGNWSFEASDFAGQYMVYFIYNNSVHEFAAKTSSSNPIYLYKQQNTSTTYYSSVVACSGTDVENVVKGEKSEKAVKVLQNGQIIIIRGTDKYTIFGQKIQ